MGDLSRVSPHLDWIQQTFVQEVGAENEWIFSLSRLCLEDISCIEDNQGRTVTYVICD